MTTIALEHPRDDSKTIIKASLEHMSSIDAYTDEGQRIVGQQEASVMGGNGARLIVDVPEMQESEDRTVIEVSAEKEVAIDMATNPEDIKSEFLDIVNGIRDRDVDDLLDELSQEMSPVESKEVSSSDRFGDAQSAIGARFVIMFVLMMLFTFMMTAMMMP